MSQNNLNNDDKNIEQSQMNDTKTKVFSKEYFKYRFSMKYCRIGFKNNWTKYLTFLSIIVAVLVLDLVLKNIFDYKTYRFIDGFISIDGFAHNTGAAFSIFSNSTLFLIILSILCLVAYLFFEYLTMDNKRGYTYYVATALMVGGTLGNLVDRIAFSYVRDFIKLEFMDFPIFNIADCALTIGVILLAIWLLFIQPKEGKKECK